MGSIVVGYMDTPAGNAALEAGIEEARRRDAAIVVVISRRGGHGESEDEALQANEAADRIRARLESEGLEFDVRLYVRGNSPAEDVIDVAVSMAAELIVIGIRRRSTTGKLILGSNALEILHDAPAPVLCVRPDS
jgi:nucleotide-binding universal stress UspA family protein